MGNLTIINLLLVLCARIAYSSPCFEKHPQCVAPSPCGNPPAKHCDSHKDHSKEEKHHKECKENEDKKKKKKGKEKHHKKSSSHEEVDVSVDIDIDIRFYGEVFTECKYVDNSEADVYLFWLDQCNGELLKYIDVLVQYLQVREALRTEIIDYQIFQEKIYSIYEIFKRKNIYSTEVDLHSKKAIIEEVKVQIIEAMKSLSEQSVLYMSLNQCLQSEITMIPLFVGLCRSIVKSQEVYNSHTSRQIIEHSKCDKDHSKENKHHEECKDEKKKKKKENNSEENEHQKKCKDKKEKKKKDSEEDEHHKKCKEKKEKKKKDSEEDEHHKKCKDKKKKKNNSEEDEHHKQCKEKEKKEKKKNKKHDEGCDDSSSGETVNINVDIDIDINYYREVFTNSEYVDNSEGEIYLFWMNKCSKEQLEYVDTIVKYLQIHEALSKEITDFHMFKEKIFSLYETFKSYDMFSAQTDLYSQKTVCEKAKVQVSEAMEGLSTQSALYSSLNYCMQSESTMLPLYVGLCRSVVLSQEAYPYFSQSSSTYTKTTSTT